MKTKDSTTEQKKPRKKKPAPYGGRKPTFRDVDHKKFAHVYFKTRSPQEAYRAIGGTGTGSRPYLRLFKEEVVIDELNKLAEQHADTTLADVVKIVEQLAIVAFSDIRDFASWTTEEVVTKEECIGEQGETIVTINHLPRVKWKNSDDLTSIESRAIQELSQDKNGQLKIKLAPSLPALELLGKYLDMFGEDQHQKARKEKSNEEQTVKKRIMDKLNKAVAAEEKKGKLRSIK